MKKILKYPRAGKINENDLDYFDFSTKKNVMLSSIVPCLLIIEALSILQAIMRFPITNALRSSGFMFKRSLSISIIIDSDAEQLESPAAMTLLPIDYPLLYRGESLGSKLYALPTDYKVDDQAIQPEVFLFKGNNSRNRLFFRTSFRLSETKFTAATFLLDAGLCSHFQFSDDLNN